MGRPASVLFLLMVWVLSISKIGFGQFETLTKWIPDNANSLVLIQVDEICQSPVAIEKNWPEKYESVCEAGIEFLPTGMRRFVVASHIDYQFMEPLWTIAAYEKSGGELRIDKVADLTGGMVDYLAGYDAVALREDVFLVKIAPTMAASMSPANRQATIRWLQRRKAGGANLSSYLTQSAAYANNKADIIVAFDLEDVLSKNQMQSWLDDANVVGKEKKQEALDALMSLRGITLGITVQNEMNAAVKVDFATDPEPLKENGKELLLHFLGMNGLMIDDFNDFKLEKYEKQLRFVGKMSPEGLRKIGLLINHPVKNAIGFGGSESRSDTSVVVRSQQYFRSIEAVVLEFERKTNVDSLGLYAKWFDRHARDIDEMSVVNVDSEMVKFGQSASDSFRQIATELRAADLNSTEGKATYSNYGYRCGRYGCYYYGNAVRELEVARGLKKARDILAEISKEAGQVRKAMSQKYGIDF
jgi:hypothetical protein